MKRMSMLAAQANSAAGELQANIAQYKEESEKEDVNEVRHVLVRSVVHFLRNICQGNKVLHHHNQEMEEGEGKGASDLESAVQKLSVASA
jgi:hypothetical protein